MRADLNRHSPGDLAHRCQQRQPAANIGDRLVGDRDGAGAQQPLGLRRIGGEMQIGEQQLVLAQRADLIGLRLLDLDDQLGDSEYIGRPRQNTRAGGLIGAIVKANRRPGAALDDDLMPLMHELANAAGHQADPVLVGFYFLWYADQHGPAPSLLVKHKARRRLCHHRLLMVASHKPPRESLTGA
jgi:hypothetical protein